MGQLPNLLSAFRLLMVPVLGALAWSGEPRAFLVALVASLLSDVLDGWLARNRGVASEVGARLDSWGDLATWATLPLFAWWLWPELLRAQAPFLGVALVAYLTPTALGLARWRRLTSYHTWAAKGTAVAMGASLLCLFAGGPAWPFQLATGLLVLEALEEIAITLVLPRPHSDVPTLWHAWRARGVEGQRRRAASRSGSMRALTVRRSRPSRRAVSS
jgi:CDP-diacylglycerol--glycerol-3-phosphate 3-phosphatidyltransferase